MKKVFEGYLFRSGMIGTPQFAGSNDLIDKKVRITVEDLPESKPEPHTFPAPDCPKCKGTGRVPHTTATPGEYEHCNCYHWRPAPAEPQGWEQKWAYLATLSAVDFEQLKADIRAEIERKVEEEKQAVFNFIWTHGLCSGAVEMIAEGIEQNKHRKTP